LLHIKQSNNNQKQLTASQQKTKKQLMTSTAQMTLFSEQEVIFKERTGKDFSTLYTKYYPKLIYFISKICKDVQKAEDISTDSFIVALEKIDKYDKEKAQFSTWLFTIARNLALQDLKIENRSISLDIEFDDEGTTLKDFIQETESNEAVYDVYSKKADVLKKHILELKEPYKTVIEMREINRMSYKDIADQLGKNLSTIKSQIRNGRQILMEQSKKEFEQIDEMYLD
jgi:RNA polymerase sigma-70 factor (ECF subfamily)